MAKEKELIYVVYDEDGFRTVADNVEEAFINSAANQDATATVYQKVKDVVINREVSFSEVKV